MNCLKKIMLSVSLLLMAVSLFAQKDITEATRELKEAVFRMVNA